MWGSPSRDLVLRKAIEHLPGQGTQPEAKAENAPMAFSKRFARGPGVLFLPWDGHDPRKAVARVLGWPCDHPFHGSLRSAHSLPGTRARAKTASQTWAAEHGIPDNYVQIYGQLPDVLKRISDGQAPDKFTRQYLKEH